MPQGRTRAILIGLLVLLVTIDFNGWFEAHVASG